MISALHALALVNPGAIDDMPDEMIAIISSCPELWLRPEQRIPKGSWRSCGYLTGRGWGKTYGIAGEINRRVVAREVSEIVLVGPTLPRVREVQAAELVAASPIWCPAETYRDGVRWANGVVAEGASAEVERPSSGSNYELAWLTEIVRWPESTRVKAYRDITTATRAGRTPQYFWDTTSSGKNEVILSLLEQHEKDPRTHLLTRGTMFDNPILPEQYVRDEIAKYVRGTRAYDEEILGLAFAEAERALWRDDWIYPYRVSSWPDNPPIVVLGLDPALSGDPTADEVGLAKAAHVNGHIFLTDLSDRMSPEDYARAVVRECQRDASGVIVERNHVGQHARDLIRVHARQAGLRVELLPDAKRSFPPRRQGTIFVREIVSRAEKGVRAAPVAALYAAGKVHHVGTLARLELEQTTWEPGTRRSPNRLDAAVFAIGELGDVSREKRNPRGAVKAAHKALRRRPGRPRGIGL
jgi:phage terminase large subunit-like protein